MAFEPVPALSPFSALSQAFGGQSGGVQPPVGAGAGAGSLGGGINNFITALMKGYQGNQPPPMPEAANAHGYEGNIPSPANPAAGGSLGMWPAQSTNPNVQQAGHGQWPGHAQPVPFLGQTTGPQPNPFMAGSSPFEFGNNPMMGALSTPPPFGRS
jgi:hypothetical protein